MSDLPAEYRVVFRWDESVKHLIHMHRTNRAHCNDRVRGKRGQKWEEWIEAGVGCGGGGLPPGGGGVDDASHGPGAVEGPDQDGPDPVFLTAGA
jgi:hypothetical protein